MYQLLWGLSDINNNLVLFWTIKQPRKPLTIELGQFIFHVYNNIYLIPLYHEYTYHILLRRRRVLHHALYRWDQGKRPRIN